LPRETGQESAKDYATHFEFENRSSKTEGERVRNRGRGIRCDV